MQNEREVTNLEKAYAAATKETQREWKQMGAAASNKAQSIRRSVSNKLEKMMQTEEAPTIMKGLLLGELTEEQRQYVRSVVPASIPDESISPLVGLTYAAIDKGLRTGDSAVLEKLMKLAGVSAEMAIKVDVKTDIRPTLDFSTMSDEELLRIIGENQDAVDVEYEEVTADVKE